MPKSVDQNVEDIADRVRASGQPSITFQWPAFYRLCDAERMRAERMEEIRVKAQRKHNLVVGYGQQVVVVSHDRNFLPG